MLKLLLPKDTVSHCGVDALTFWQEFIAHGLMMSIQIMTLIQIASQYALAD